MPNLFTSIGFKVETSLDFLALLQTTNERGETLNARHGYYVRWSPGAGAELWLRVNAEREVVGCVPHFAGDGVMSVGIARFVDKAGSRGLDGSIDGWAGPDSDTADSGLFPILLDVPDFDILRRHTRPPATVQVQIAAFAADLSCYDSVDDFMAKKAVDPRISVETFIPTGMFLGDTEGTGSVAEALIGGIVQRAALRINPEGNQGFWALLVQTFGGTVDIVADPLVVTGEPVVGGVVSGTFYLSARVRPDTSETAPADPDVSATDL